MTPNPISSTQQSASPRRPRRKSLPLPHEHGAWVILYVSLALGIGSAPVFQPVPAALVLLAATGIYLSQNVAALLFRKKSKDGMLFWFAGFGLVALAGGLPLLWVYRRYALLGVGGVALLLFALLAALAALPNRRRMDRSLLGEGFAVIALTLAAPAGRIALLGAWDLRASLTWAICALFFWSSIFNVKMILAAGKVKGVFTQADRWRVGRAHLIYHGGLAAVALGLGLRGDLLLSAAFLPVLARAFYTWSRLTNRLPNFKVTGMLESLYSLWFFGFALAALETL